MRYELVYWFGCSSATHKKRTRIKRVLIRLMATILVQGVAFTHSLIFSGRLLVTIVAFPHLQASCKFRFLLHCSLSLPQTSCGGNPYWFGYSTESIKKEPAINGLSSGWWQRSIFSGRLQPNIVDAWKLNFCVRNGNKWNLSTIITIMVHWTQPFGCLEQWQLHISARLAPAVQLNL